MEVSWCFLRSKSGDCSVIGDGAVRLLVCSVVGLLPEYLVVSPVLLELYFGSSMVTSEWVAGARSLTADVLVSQISCGFPMRGVGFLVQKEEEDGGSTVWSMMKMIGEQYWLLGSCVFPLSWQRVDWIPLYWGSLPSW